MSVYLYLAKYPVSGTGRRNFREDSGTNLIKFRYIWKFLLQFVPIKKFTLNQPAKNVVVFNQRVEKGLIG